MYLGLNRQVMQMYDSRHLYYDKLRIKINIEKVTLNTKPIIKNRPYKLFHFFSGYYPSHFLYSFYDSIHIKTALSVQLGLLSMFNDLVRNS